MIKRTGIRLLQSTADFHTTMETVIMLNKYINDERLPEIMYCTTIEIGDESLKEAVILALNQNAPEACRRFCQIALNTEDPNCRRWALIYLRLMEYPNAREAVLTGLKDPDPSVQLAAAFNTVLYGDDNDIREAVEIFFARNRFFFTVDGWCRLKNVSRKMTGRLPKEYKEDFQDQIKTAWEIQESCPSAMSSENTGNQI